MLRAGNLAKAAILSALVALPLWGCKLVRAGRPVPVGAPAGPAVSRPQVSMAKLEREVERKVRARIEEEARREAERKAVEEIDRLRREAVEVDLEVVAGLLDRAKAAVLEKDFGRLASALGMLRSALGVVCSGSAPGATEASLLRALRLLEGGDTEGAKFHLRVACEAAKGLGEVGGVKVADRLSSALSALEGGKLDEAKRALEETEAALRGHPLFQTVERLFEHFDGALSAAGRGAWKVAEAELEEASDLLPSLREAVGLAAPKGAVEEKAKPSGPGPAPTPPGPQTTPQQQQPQQGPPGTPAPPPAGPAAGPERARGSPAATPPGTA